MTESTTLTKFERRLLVTAGIMLVLACLLVVGIGAFMALGSLQSAFGPHREAVVVTPTEPDEEKFVLGAPLTLAGSSKLIFSLAAKHEAKTLSLKGEYNHQPTRNYLIYDYKSTESEWLWQSSQQMILDYQVLGARQNNGADKGRLIQAKYLALVYVANDTSADQKLDSRDKRAVRIYSLETGASKDILDDAEEILTLKQIDEDSMLVVFTGSGKTFILVYDLAKATVVSTKVLKFSS